MGKDPDDTALMLRYRDGDMAAFETLYARHRVSLFRFVLRHTANRQLAEDVFQETWSRIIRNSSRYRPNARFTTYLYHIARNCMIDQYRRTANQPAAGPNIERERIDDLASSDNPLTNAAAADTALTIERALLTLPDEQREAFLLKEEAGFTLQEIAEITGVGRETVKSRLRYALGSLREHLSTASELSLQDG